MKNGNFKPSNFVYLFADCKSGNPNNNSNFISIDHSMLEIKTATPIGDALSIDT